ncbi:MAG: hypothetical protein NTZ05_02030 [Chloroflexi bacterium]|nr:hypothetical protein [Chloroflexota bacterium]
MFYLDMHVHSADMSDDSVATVEGYAKWIVNRRKKGFRVDGIVLTEHRGFNRDADYTALGEQYGLVVLRGSEIETDMGHVLVFGVTNKLLESVDFRNIRLPAAEVIPMIKDFGGFAVAAHPGRARTGIWEPMQGGKDVSMFEAMELLNGGSNFDENARAAEVLELRRFLGVTGGSDAHYVSAIGKCLTAFERPIHHMEDLVEEMYRGGFRAVLGADTLERAGESSAR